MKKYLNALLYYVAVFGIALGVLFLVIKTGTTGMIIIVSILFLLLVFIKANHDQ
jgi:hypothetical protein